VDADEIRLILLKAFPLRMVAFPGLFQVGALSDEESRVPEADAAFHGLSDSDDIDAAHRFEGSVKREYFEGILPAAGPRKGNLADLFHGCSSNRYFSSV